MSGIRPNEYWGSIVEREAPEGDVPPRSHHRKRSRERGPTTDCAEHGHTWPEGRKAGPCERCGKESAIPAGPMCRHGVPVAFGGHDCRYADARGALVPYAELAADRDVPDGGTIDGTVSWDAAFHRHMDALAALARRLGRRS